MTYLYEKDRESFARRLLEAANFSQNLRDDLISKFKNLNGLEISNTEQDELIKWSRNNQFEAKKTISENLNDPIGIISKMRSLI